jgi:hypothetical protein
MSKYANTVAKKIEKNSNKLQANLTVTLHWSGSYLWVEPSEGQQKANQQSAHTVSGKYHNVTVIRNLANRLTDGRQI